MVEVIVNTVEYYTRLHENKKSEDLKKILVSSKNEFWSYNGQPEMGDRMIELLHEIVSIDNILKGRGD